MRTEEINIYKFDELMNNESKERARAWFREGLEYPWWDDGMKSVNHFCNHFGVKLLDYEVSTHRPYFIKTDASNAHFRGYKLKRVDAGATMTGYCLDYTLWYTFHKTFRATGDAKCAFNDALHAAFKDMVADMEWHETDECIDELLTINEYEFTADGRRY